MTSCQENNSKLFSSPKNEPVLDDRGGTACDAFSRNLINLPRHQKTVFVAYAEKKRHFFVVIVPSASSAVDSLSCSTHTPAAGALPEIHFCVFMWDFFHDVPFSSQWTFVFVSKLASIVGQSILVQNGLPSPWATYVILFHSHSLSSSGKKSA